MRSDSDVIICVLILLSIDFASQNSLRSVLLVPRRNYVKIIFLNSFSGGTLLPPSPEAWHSAMTMMFSFLDSPKYNLTIFPTPYITPPLGDGGICQSMGFRPFLTK